jgi:hypothetical protein
MTIEDKLAYAKKIYKQHSKIRAVLYSDGSWCNLIRRSLGEPRIYQDIQGYEWIISNHNLYNPITDTWSLVYDKDLDIWINPKEQVFIPKILKRFIFAN